MDKENKINYGLKNVYYSKITEKQTEDGVTVEYGTPVRIPGAVSMSMPKNAERVPIAADDDAEYAVIYNNKGYDGETVFYNVPDSFLTDCMGMKIDGDTIVENKDDKPSPFALLFEFNGDNKKRRHIFYRCMGTNPDVASQTKGDGTTANQITVKMTATPAKDTGDIKRTCKEGDSDVYKNWFTTVQTSGNAAAAGE